MINQQIPLSLNSLVYVLLTLMAGKVLYDFINFIFFPYFSHLRKLNGPNSKSWYYGWSKPEIIANLSQELVKKHKEFGKTFFAISVHRTPTLYTIDENAINFIYQNEFSTSSTKKPELFRRGTFFVHALTSFFGKIVLGVEGETHSRQRKSMSSAFSDHSIRQSSVLMYETVETLMEIWQKEYESKIVDTNEFVQIDISSNMRNVAMDIIGNAGFGQDLGALKKRATKLNQSYHNLCGKLFSPNLYLMIRFQFPWIIKLTKHFSKFEKQIQKDRKEVQKYSKHLVDIADKETKEESAIEDRNVLRLIKRASLLEKNKNQNTITDEELREGVPILLLAGYDTTSSAMIWSFHEMTKDVEGMQLQSLLRSEIKAEKNQEWRNDFTILNRLPLLDAICSEVMRLHPSIGVSSRKCIIDTCIPLSSSIRLKDGTFTNQIQMRKGEVIYFSISAVNTSESNWGKDAKKFLPQRWLNKDHELFDSNISKTSSQLTSWNHILTFGQGIRMCLGYRFALAEFKIVLAYCIDRFEWKSANDIRTGKPIEVETSGQSFIRPVIKGAKKGENSIPILMRAIV